MIYNAFGNCLDASGERARAIEIYRKGLVISPGDPQLQYNLAISLMMKNKTAEVREARGLLERELVTRPAHASGHYALARLFQAQHFSVPAIFEYLRFLILEPSTPRSKTSAAAAIALMNGFVKVEGKDIKITIDPTRGEEGDFGVAEMMLGLSGAAAQMAEESKDKLEIEKLAEQLEVIVSMLTESSEPRQNFTAQTNLPFFGAMRDKNLIEPFVYVGFSSLELPGTQDWIARNKRKVEAYQRWVEANGREKAIPVPQ
jgi:tetratricopeptide (TPR) repeat protein